MTPSPIAPAVRVRARTCWDGSPVPPAGRFTGSDFAPLVVAVADRCLRLRHGPPPLPRPYGERTALILATVRGDTATLDAVARAAAARTPVPKPYLATSVPTAAPGHVAVEWGLTGPVLSVTPMRSPVEDGLELAAQLIAVGDAAEVLLITADLPDQAAAMVVGT